MRPHRLAWLAVAVATVGALLSSPPDLLAQDDVASTPHNLSTSNGGGPPTGATINDYNEICVYCHTPHGGQVDAPLWNRAFPTGPYQMYSSATLDMVQDGAPTGVSLACLGCHDGTIGLDVITNPPNSFGGPTATTVPGTNTMPAGSFALLDADLRNDHPISVAYDLGQDPSFNAEADVLLAGLKLFTDPSSAGNKIQCASCHNPHNNTNQPFLRLDNAGSALCLTCHIK